MVAVSQSAAFAEIGDRPNEMIERYRLALCDLFPRATEAEVVDAVVTREHRATFAGRPGTRKLRPGPTTALGGLFLAGAWTATGWPATMEGAVRSGNRAARLALYHCCRVSSPSESSPSGVSSSSPSESSPSGVSSSGTSSPGKSSSSEETSPGSPVPTERVTA